MHCSSHCSFHHHHHHAAECNVIDNTCFSDAKHFIGDYSVKSGTGSCMSFAMVCHGMSMWSFWPLAVWKVCLLCNVLP